MKQIIFGILIIIILVLSGCSKLDISNLSDEDLARLSDNLIECNAPYIRYGVDCCLDQNSNSICDNDENNQNITEDILEETEQVEVIKTDEETTEEAVDETKLCSDYVGSDICSSDEICNGNTLDVVEDNCCSMTCSEIVECYSDSQCSSRFSCTNHECIAKESSINYDLSQFPEEFADDELMMVVGSDSSAAVTLAMADITSAIQYYSGNTFTPQTDYAINIDSLNYNFIALQQVDECYTGGLNTIAEYLGFNCDDWQYGEGYGTIEVVQNGDRYAIIIAGTTGEDIRRTSKVLLNKEYYQISGTKVLVTGENLEDINVEILD